MKRRAWVAAVVVGLVAAGLAWRAGRDDPDRLLRDGQDAARRLGLKAGEERADRLARAGQTEHAALLRAEVAYRRGDYPRAERFLRGVDGASPLFAQAAVLFGHCRFKQNDMRLAESLFRRAAEVQPDDPAPRRGLADVYYALGAMTLASVEFREVARLAPDDPRPWLALGLLYDDVGERVKAADAFTRAVDLSARPGTDPDLFARARLGLAESLTYVGELDRAIKVLDELPPAIRQAPHAAVLRAEALFRQSELAASSQALAGVFAAPDPPAAALLLGGRLAVAQNQFEPAAALLERAVKVDPASSEASHQLVGVYRLLGRSADADRQQETTARIKADLERMSRLNDVVWGKPWDAEARQELVAVMTRLGKADIAARWAQAAAGARAGP